LISNSEKKHKIQVSFKRFFICKFIKKGFWTIKICLFFYAIF
jgi:hypothetical protein